jgi:hypothetical protein
MTDVTTTQARAERDNRTELVELWYRMEDGQPAGPSGPVDVITFALETPEARKAWHELPVDGDGSIDGASDEARAFARQYLGGKIQDLIAADTGTEADVLLSRGVKCYLQRDTAKRRTRAEFEAHVAAMAVRV